MRHLNLSRIATGDARDLIIANKNLIANEAVERMLTVYPASLFLVVTRTALTTL